MKKNHLRNISLGGFPIEIENKISNLLWYSLAAFIIYVRIGKNKNVLSLLICVSNYDRKSTLRIPVVNSSYGDPVCQCIEQNKSFYRSSRTQFIIFPNHPFYFNESLYFKENNVSVQIRSEKWRCCDPYLRFRSQDVDLRFQWSSPRRRVMILNLFYCQPL